MTTGNPTALRTAEDVPARPAKALIIGAGVAGLAAALRLGEGGKYSAAIFERDPVPGGLARSLHFKGVSTDLGPHRIYTEIPEVQQLIHRIAAPSLFTVRRKSHIYLRGKFLPYPPSPMAMTRHLGPLAMAKFGLSYFRTRIGSSGREETYESLMRRAFGAELYNYLLRPYTEKTWKTDPANLHADTARVRVSAGSLAKMMTGLIRREQHGKQTALREFQYVRGGAETLVRHLWEHARDAGAQLHLNHEIMTLDINDGLRVTGARVRLSVPHGSTASQEPQTHPADLLISTIPLPLLLGRVLPAIPQLDDARAAAEGLQYLNMMIVVLIVRRKVITGDNWLYFPEPHLIFNRGYEAKSMDPTMVDEDRSVLCLEITLQKNDPRWSDSDDALLKTVISQVASTGLFGADEVDEGYVHRLPFAYPLYLLDYDKRLDRVFAGLAKVPNLITLGRQGLFNHNNMDHSIYMGLQAADLLNRHPLEAAVQAWYARAGQFKRMRIVD